MSDDITSLRVQVHGFVQGVGFRDFLVMAAQAQKLDGWVRNRSDGSVEALAIGAPHQIAALIEACRQGPHGARVTAVTIADAEDDGSRGFGALPTG